MKKILLVTVAIAALASTSASAWTTHHWGSGNRYTSTIVAESDTGNATSGQAAAVGNNTATGTMSGGASGQLTGVVTDNNGNADGLAAAGEISGSAAGAIATDPNNASTAVSTDAAGGSLSSVTETNRWGSWRTRGVTH